MIIARSKTVAVALCAAAAVLAGCGGSASQMAAPNYQASGNHSQSSLKTLPGHGLDFLAPQYRSRRLVWQGNPGKGWMSPDVTRRHLIYVSDEGGQAVYIFPRWGKNQAPIGKITSGLLAPNGLFVDSARNLYVCNFGGGTVTVYPNGATSPSLTLTGAGSPIDVVVGLDGTVYVSNWDSGSAGTLLEYPKGHTTPSVTINIDGASEGLALDRRNNLYVAYTPNTINDGEVLKFAPGSTVGTNLGIHIGSVGGATMDSAGNLLLDDQGIPAVDVFPPGATQPSQQIRGFSLAFDIALNHPNTRLWVTDPFTAVYEVTYPGGQIVNTITNTISSAFGVATSPDGSD